MTNTKFRKRALLSSVAMLLVALVALGSATFAWFTSNPDAEAHGLSVKATTDTGLVIKTESDPTYSHSATINNEGSQINLLPATWKEDTDSFFTIEAAKDNEPGADPTATFSAANVARTGTAAMVYKEKVTLKVTGGVDAKAYLTDITLTSKNKDMSNAVTVLLTDSSYNKLAEYSASGATLKRYPKATLEASKTTAQVGATSNVTVTAQGVDVNLDLGTVSSLDAGTDFYVFVYLDGENANVFTRKASADELVSNIQLNFTTTAPTSEP